MPSGKRLCKNGVPFRTIWRAFCQKAMQKWRAFLVNLACLFPEGYSKMVCLFWSIWHAFCLVADSKMQAEDGSRNPSSDFMSSCVPSPCSCVHVFMCSCLFVHVFMCQHVHVSRVHVFTCPRVHVFTCSRVHPFCRNLWPGSEQT